MYAVVDIETTGGKAIEHGITEIAVVHHDGHEITGRYSSLVNPRQWIPPHITALTGISNEMVEGAPLFEEIAEEILRQTEGRIFVAHSASFDYGFISRAFAAIGIPFERDVLCTVRLARKVIPGLPSYSLGNLCERFGIANAARHRALGDAEATAELLGRYLLDDPDRIRTVLRKAGQSGLPAGVPHEWLDGVPRTQGLIYFHDEQGKTLFIGKGRNLRKEAISRIRKIWNKPTDKLRPAGIGGLSAEAAGGDFFTEWMFRREVSRLSPPANPKPRNPRMRGAIYSYEDQQGYLRFRAGAASAPGEVLALFKGEPEALGALRQRIAELSLCPRLGGVSREPCDPACACTSDPAVYNDLAGSLAESWIGPLGRYLIVDLGRVPGESAVLAVEDGRFVAWGWLESAILDGDPCYVTELLRPIKPAEDATPLLRTTDWQEPGFRLIEW